MSWNLPNRFVVRIFSAFTQTSDLNFFFAFIASNGYGEVMERSFGIWHTKCFPKDSPPTQDELEVLCRKLGFKETKTAHGRVSGSQNGTIPVEFHQFNATKVVPFNKFSPVSLNDGFAVHLRPSKPMAKLVSWDISDHEKCHRMELKCIEE